MAGLIARINQQLGKPAGFINPLLYAQEPGASTTSPPAITTSPGRSEGIKLVQVGTLAPAGGAPTGPDWLKC
jgi:hypothetical protein